MTLTAPLAETMAFAPSLKLTFVPAVLGLPTTATLRKFKRKCLPFTAEH